MSDNTGIEWTDATWNPVVGCTKVSPGCDHCYAERVTERFHGKGSFANVRHHSERLAQPYRWRKPRRIFVNSMSDLFHDEIPDRFIAEVFAVMEANQRHTFQILTKRHGRMRSLLSSREFVALVDDARVARLPGCGDFVWPLPNAWLGVSVEDQQWADIRIPALLETPAAVRFLSCEPLLGPVDLSKWMPPGLAKWRCSGCRNFYSGHHRVICPGCDRLNYWTGSHVGNGRPNGQPLGWVIVGGESGPGARVMHREFAQIIRDQCNAADVPFLFKQWGSHDEHGTRMSKHTAGRILDGRTWDEYPQPLVGVA